ncbi:MAG: type III-A CRISPR-associated RAMP protein Csm3 [Rhodocyclaceae bacterium]|nr:type III-A CRISPR-associated RAMP protein Csm3 [Rhodocyclaceae bacterium]
MQLSHIRTLTARLVLETGLHIGAGDSEMHIGGIDNPVIKNPITHQPYIPGSSLKGKMRSLLEWRTGAVKPGVLGYKDFVSAQEEKQREQIGAIVKLFGISGSEQLDEKQALEIGPTRLAFWDCEMTADSANLPREQQTEEKSEVSIDRISGTAKNGSLRNTERVPAGVAFDFRLSLKVIDDENLLPTVLVGLRLIELDSLGGSGSRGYGKVRFADLKLDGEPIELPQDPFAA